MDRRLLPRSRGPGASSRGPTSRRRPTKSPPTIRASPTPTTSRLPMGWASSSSRPARASKLQVARMPGRHRECLLTPTIPPSSRRFPHAATRSSPNIGRWRACAQGLPGSVKTAARPVTSPPCAAHAPAAGAEGPKSPRLCLRQRDAGGSPLAGGSNGGAWRPLRQKPGEGPLTGLAATAATAASERT
jgi:hypothetical protein